MRRKTSAALLVVLGVCLGAAGAWQTRDAHAQHGAPGASIPDVAEAVVQSVVSIAATSEARRARGPFGDPFLFFGPRTRRHHTPPLFQQSAGSGVIVSKDGLVITNNHVVDDARDIKVTLSDGREFSAKLVGTDPHTDVAVIRLEGELGELRPMQWGDSDAMRLGETVLAVGNPFGTLGHTVTMGIISAKGRSAGLADYEDFLQTDAAINPGNSGGALVNTAGQLVGINTAIASQTGGYQGVGFAIPAKMARKVMDALVSGGNVRRGSLGVYIQDLDPAIAEALDLEVKEGVLVSDVVPGSPAAKAGLTRGDVVVSVDGKPVKGSRALRNTVALAGPGAKVELAYFRRGERKSVRVELDELGGAKPGGKVGHGKVEDAIDGLRLGELTSEVREKLEVGRGVDGVVVRAVDPGSAAHQSGLRPGDVLMEINQRPVRGLADARRRLKRGKALLLVHREGRTVFLVLRS